MTAVEVYLKEAEPLGMHSQAEPGNEGTVPLALRDVMIWELSADDRKSSLLNCLGEVLKSGN